MIVSLVACGGAQHPASGPVDAGRGAAPADDPPPLPSDRALAADATFADLVQAAVRQDERRASDSEAGCLVRAATSGFVLEADLSVAVRGLPAAPDDLADRARASGGRARVLTRLGGYGTASSLVAVALTTIAGASPRRGALLVQTAEGVFLLGTEDPGAAEPLAIAAVVERLASMDVASVFVTADGRTSLSELLRLLAALPASLAGRVALATVLPEDAIAPAEASDDTATPHGAICEGLPSLADDAAVGELDTASLRAALGSLVPAGQACVATSASGLGGLVRVAFRIADDGHVREACVVEDETGDPTLRACLVDALMAMAFPRPTGGSVDVELPLRLELQHDAAHHQRPVCE